LLFSFGYRDVRTYGKYYGSYEFCSEYILHAEHYNRS